MMGGGGMVFEAGDRGPLRSGLEIDKGQEKRCATNSNGDDVPLCVQPVT